ncbi:uncharacterized protein LOC125041245 [Penaeus chinensis]|uniref:uncharacterized protein LOC125041245 n=1 Tax=Penaeus chinensis TaxID=139456 RepID=UPI001FB7595B|nr:uncharacterized protein LOC125041245 [Penaeus chinensis]
MAWSWAPSNFNYPGQSNAIHYGGRGTAQQLPNAPLCDLLGLPVPVHTSNHNNNVQHRNRPRQYYEPRGQFHQRRFPAPHYNNHRNRPQNRPLLSNPYLHENRQPRFTQNPRNPTFVGNPRNPTFVGNPRNPTSVGDPTQGTNSRWMQEWQRVETMNLVRSVTIKHDPFYDVHDTILQNIIIKKNSEQMQLTFKFNLRSDQLENLRSDDMYQGRSSTGPHYTMQHFQYQLLLGQ